MSTLRQRIFERRQPDARSRFLTASGVALLFLALVVAGFLVYQNAGIMFEQIRDDFNQQQLILARQAAAQVDADLGDIAVAVASLAHNLPPTGADADGYGLRAFYE